MQVGSQHKRPHGARHADSNMRHFYGNIIFPQIMKKGSILLLECIFLQVLLYLVLGLYYTKYDNPHPEVIFFCEQNRNQSLFIQEANAWSSVSYQVVAWMCILLLSLDDIPLSGYEIIAPMLIGLVGIGSLAFHGLVHLWAGLVDYIFLDAYICYELSVSIFGDNRIQRIFYVSLTACTLLVVYLAPPLIYDEGYLLYLPDVGLSSLVIVATLITAFFITNAYLIKNRGILRKDLLLILALAFLICGFSFWLAFNGDCSSATSHIQGHAAWHVFTSLAMGSVFVHRVIH